MHSFLSSFTLAIVSIIPHGVLFCFVVVVVVVVVYDMLGMEIFHMNLPTILSLIFKVRESMGVAGRLLYLQQFPFSTLPSIEDHI